MRSVFGGLLLLLTLAGLEARAQEADSVDVADESRDAVTEEQQAAERDELEPGVPSTVLAADIRRGTQSNRVMDELDLGRTEITGNQELPTVLYIVPWQKSDPGDLMGRPVNTLLDEILAPIDRTEFVRQIDYYDDLYGESDQ
jgi:hypothetical protein